MSDVTSAARWIRKASTGPTGQESSVITVTAARR